MRFSIFTSLGFLGLYFLFRLAGVLMDKANTGDIKWGTLGLIGSIAIISIFVLLLVFNFRKTSDSEQ